MSLWLAWIGLFEAQAAPTVEALQAAWQSVAGAVSGSARFPVTPRPSDLATVAAGGVARRRLADPKGDRAMGIGWSPYGQAALWVGIIDDQHFTLVKGLREQQLPGTTLTRKLLFQHLDLPWPLSDRQWVIELRNNEPLWRSTGGAAWERYWTLADAGLATDPNPEGVWLPACEGAWLLVDGCRPVRAPGCWSTPTLAPWWCTRRAPRSAASSAPTSRRPGRSPPSRA